MSTDHQQYSIENQFEAIDTYAQEHHMEIVRTYSDAGKTGLTLEDRPGLRQLLEDVEAGFPGYSVILVTTSAAGSISGCGRERFLRISMPSREYRSALLRGVLSQRRKSVRYALEDSQTSHGGRVQPGAFSQSVRGKGETN